MIALVLKTGFEIEEQSSNEGPSDKETHDTRHLSLQKKMCTLHPETFAL